jgi:hypothetical protein
MMTFDGWVGKHLDDIEFTDNHCRPAKATCIISCALSCHVRSTTQTHHPCRFSRRLLVQNRIASAGRPIAVDHTRRRSRRPRYSPSLSLQPSSVSLALDPGPAGTPASHRRRHLFGHLKSQSNGRRLTSLTPATPRPIHPQAPLSIACHTRHDERL